MVSYYTYVALSVGIPVTGLATFGLLVPIVLGMFMSFFYFRKCHRLPGLIGRVFIVEFEEELVGERRYDYFICGQKVNSFTVAAICCVGVLEFLCALIAFWTTFLSDSELGCQDTSWDCFPIITLNSSLLDNRFRPLSVEDCARYDSLDNVTIICFKFVFEYAEGLSEAGGLVFALSLGTNLYIGVFVLINRIQSNSWKYFLRFFVSCVGIALFILPFMLFSFRDGRETLLTPNRYLQFALYMVTLFFVVFVLGLSMCIRIPKFDLEAELRRRATVRRSHHGHARHPPSTFEAVSSELEMDSSLNMNESMSTVYDPPTSRTRWGTL